MLVSHLEGSLLRITTAHIFCRYISTASMSNLKTRFPNYTVEIVHGELSAEERQDRIAEMGTLEKVILVQPTAFRRSTLRIISMRLSIMICLNPTRHEQREGRVDRFDKIPGVAPDVLRGYPIDGFIINVGLRKATRLSRSWESGADSREQRSLGTPGPGCVAEKVVHEGTWSAFLISGKPASCGCL